MLFNRIAAALSADFIPAAESDASGMTMAQFLSTASDVASWLWGQVGTASSTVMNNPMLSTPFYIFIIGASVGLFGRLFRI